MLVWRKYTGMSNFKIFLASVPYNKKDNWIVEQDYPVLLSQVNDWGVVKQIVADRRESKLKNDFFIDSGAFTALTKGIEISIDDYIAKIDTIGENITLWANLDVIPKKNGLTLGLIDSVTLAGVRECVDLGWKNFLYIQEHSKYAYKCAFVYHQNDAAEYLDMAIEYYKNHPELKYIALGGMHVGDCRTFQWAVKTCNRLKRELPNVKIHLFGYTRMNELPHIHADSTDSTVYIMNSIYGLIITPFGKLFISERQTARGNSFDCWSKPEQDKIVKWVTDFGFDFEKLRVSQQERLKFNAKYLQWWADKYEYQPTTTIGKKSLF